VQVVVGRVVGAHGTRGEIRVRLASDSPENLLSLAQVALADPEKGAGDPAPLCYEVEGGARGRVGEARLRLKGLTLREQALALRGRWVLGDPARFLELPAGEFYSYQLVGCRVAVEGRPAFGTVREVWATAGHDVLVVEGDDGRRRLIPTARAIMLRVEPEARRIVIADIEGLVEPAP